MGLSPLVPLTTTLKRLSLITPTTRSSSRLTLLRSTSTSSSASPYPYSSTAKVISTPSSTTTSTSTGSLLHTLNSHLTSFHPLQSHYYSSLLSRRSPSRLLPGSVVTITSYTSLPTSLNPTPSTNTFSGVLIALRRRNNGTDHSLRLRNLVGRTGVEISYKVFSPMIKEIKVVAHATRSGPRIVNKDGTEAPRKKATLKASKRAKMYYLRDQPGRLVGVGGIVKQAREREAQLEKRRR